MKTAMQELLDIIYKAISNAEELKSNGLNHKGDIDIMLNVLNVYRVIIERDMLEKEKEQIKDAFKYGWNWNYDAEKYYNETYG